jgi:hypothetical protein
MLAWDDLPREIRLLILRTFCSDIIDEFECLSTSIWDDGSFLDNDAELPLAWPPTPAPLRSFMAAFTSCREFNYIIVHQVKFDGLSPIDVLKDQQEDSLLACIKCNSTRLFHVPFFYQATGSFWKNTSIITNVTMMTMVLIRSKTRSFQMLLPHVEPVLNTLLARRESSEPLANPVLSYVAEAEGGVRLDHFEVKCGSQCWFKLIGKVESV